MSPGVWHKEVNTLFGSAFSFMSGCDAAAGRGRAVSSLGL